MKTKEKAGQRKIVLPILLAASLLLAAGGWGTAINFYLSRTPRLNPGAQENLMDNPLMALSDSDLLQTIERRNSTPRGGFTGKEISEEALQVLGWAATGKNRSGTGFVIPLALGVEPYVSIYLAQESGVRRFYWESNSFENVTREDMRDKVNQGQNASAIWIYVIDVDNVPMGDMDFAWHAIGAMSQHQYLMADLLDIQARYMGLPKADEVASLLGLNASNHIPCGRDGNGAKINANCYFNFKTGRFAIMNLYETIFVRRSVRQYDKTPLDEAALSEIKNYLSNAKQSFDQSARFEIVGNEKLKGGLAPYAILAYSDNDDAAIVNIGYTLQGMDLWLQSVGYGSIWCGMASPKDPAQNYRILLGFGKTGVALRKGEDDFKRKKISEISDAENAVARAVRVAPSAVNFQPWKLRFADGKVTVAANVRGVGKLLPGRLFLFDLGIALKHIELALENEVNTITAFAIHGKGKNISIEVDYK